MFELVERQSGETPPELQDLAALPQSGEHIWEWFNALSRRRSSSGFSLLPLTHTEVWSWSQLTGNKPTPWEVETLFDLDLLFMAEYAKGD